MLEQRYIVAELVITTVGTIDRQALRADVAARMGVQP